MCAPSLSNIHLAFFLSRATSLSRWHRLGIYTREITLYKRLAKYVGKLSIVTSGGKEELDFQSDFNNVEGQHFFKQENT